MCSVARRARQSGPRRRSSRSSRRQAGGRTPEKRASGASPSKNAKRLQAALERKIEAAEAALTCVEDEPADPAAWSDPERSVSSERPAGAKRQVEEAYARLEAAGG
jgi:ATP-binding cassette, subfamily F, member 3